MKWRPTRRRVEKRLSDVQNQVAGQTMAILSIQRRLDSIDALIRDLHTDAWNANALRQETVLIELKSIRDVSRSEIVHTRDFVRNLNDELTRKIMQNHADTWNADEKRALSLADVVLISISPQIDAIKRDLIALVGEKAVEVFQEVSRNG